MVRTGVRKIGMFLGALLCACTLLPAQQQEQVLAQLNESGHIMVDGRSTPYLIRRLPVSSFPGLPEEFVSLLNRRGCLIPQTYEAHHPENVVHASLERAGSSDWAVLCSADGMVSLLVFFQHAPTSVLVLTAAPETERLQAHDPSGVLGFNWGIDPASPEQIRQAQIGMKYRPARLDHDALADSIVEGRTVYHFYAKSSWTVLEMPDY
ncbi:MAG: hypothetical protein ABSE51_20770 [Terracidiphilus sp.]|jgi:hypothetical protein